MKLAVVGMVAALAILTDAAEGAWGLRFDVSSDSGATWHSRVTAKAGEVVAFRFGAYFDTTTIVRSPSGTGVAQTLGRFVGQNRVDGMSASDSIRNIVRHTSNGNPAVLAISGNLIGTTGTNSFASNLYLHAVPTEPSYLTPIYSGEIVIGSEVGPGRLMTIMNNTFGAGPLVGLTFFNAGQIQKREIGAPIDSPAHTDINATIEVLASTTSVPAPATLVPMVAAVVFARRRR